MKRICILAWILAMTVAICSGCGEKTEDAPSLPPEKTEDARLLLPKEDGIGKVSISSLPAGYRYTFSEEDADAIVDYLLGLHLLSDFQEDPDGYTGMTWEISIEYESGETATVYHFGNMFIRTEHGPWYKMQYEEASRLDALLSELNK